MGVLSGGERNRLMLARALAQPSNLLVLDEPTNDLDLETLDLLEEMIDDYAGTVILVSHDRDFLDRTAPGGGRRGAFRRPHRREGGEPERRQAGRRRSGPGKRKLSFNEQHDLKTLPRRMDEIGAKIAKVQEILADHELYSCDPARFQKAMDALTALQSELHTAEERWLELEMLRRAPWCSCAANTLRTHWPGLRSRVRRRRRRRPDPSVRGRASGRAHHRERTRRRQRRRSRGE